MKHVLRSGIPAPLPTSVDKMMHIAADVLTMADASVWIELLQSVPPDKMELAMGLVEAFQRADEIWRSDPGLRYKYMVTTAERR